MLVCVGVAAVCWLFVYVLWWPVCCWLLCCWLWVCRSVCSCQAPNYRDGVPLYRMNACVCCGCCVLVVCVHVVVACVLPACVLLALSLCVCLLPSGVGQLGVRSQMLTALVLWQCVCVLLWLLCVGWLCVCCGHLCVAGLCDAGSESVRLCVAVGGWLARHRITESDRSCVIAMPVYGVAAVCWLFVCMLWWPMRCWVVCCWL